LLALGGLLPRTSSAHEVRPAYLEITEAPSHHVSVLWKQPAQGEVAVRLNPHLSSGWLDATQPELSATPSFVVKRWRDIAPGSATLTGQVLTIEGLESSITDVLVKVTFADGTHLERVVKPKNPSLVVQAGGAKAPRVPAYLSLGIEHILLGFDHLLFVLGLVLLVKGQGRLVRTITAFTLAHSITLTCATLGWVHVQPAVVEAIIALSILFLALELVRAARGDEGITTRRPWLVAFSFGLLHGFGFARALSEVGLPQDDVPLALVLFNSGVEIGQLLFVAGVLSLLALVPRLHLRFPIPSRVAPAYAIGVCAAYWLIERLVAIAA
jgi:hydrogenase/urease accessory protein HupE